MAFERLKHTAVGFIPEVRRARKEVAQNDYDATRADVDTVRPIDKLRTDVTEVLGERKGVLEGGYRRKADSLVKKVESSEARKDKVGMREAFIRHGKNKTELKIQRVEAKIDAGAKDNGFLARQRNAKLKQLQYNQKVRSNAIKKLETNRLKKPEKNQKKIDELVQKKIQSMMRKAERKVLQREHGIGRFERRKRTEKLVNLSPEEKRRIVREAILMVRRQNIERGVLDDTYRVDDTTTNTRPVGKDYARIIE